MVKGRSSTGRPRRRAASRAAPRVTPGRMRGPLGAVRRMPPQTQKRLAFVPSQAIPSRVRIASMAPASRAFWAASTLGRSITVLMSQRPQRSSGTRIAEPPSGGGSGSDGRANAKIVGVTLAAGKACVRGAAPRETCAHPPHVLGQTVGPSAVEPGDFIDRVRKEKSAVLGRDARLLPGEVLSVQVNDHLRGILRRLSLALPVILRSGHFSLSF